MTSDRRVTFGVGGLVLAALGTYLVSDSSGAPFLLGVVLLVVGIALLVRVLLMLTEASSAKAPATTAASRGSGLISLGGLKNIPELGKWISGAVMGLLSIFGLFLYGRATDGMFATFGGLLFLFGLAVIIVFVHQATDYSSPTSKDETAGGAGQS